MDLSHSSWTPPEPVWPSARPRPAAPAVQFAWSLAASSVVHVALAVALVEIGWGLAARPWTLAHGRASVEQQASLAAWSSPAETPTQEEAADAAAETPVVEIVDSAPPGGEEGQREPASWELARSPARIGRVSMAASAVVLPELRWEPRPGPRAPGTSSAQERTDPHREPAAQHPPASTTPASVAALAQAESRASYGAEADDLPRVVENPAPVYPPELLAARIEGRVVLRVTVSAQGRVEQASVHRSSGREAFDQAALKSIRYWRFAPAFKNGVPVEYSVAVPVRFVIER